MFSFKLELGKETKKLMDLTIPMGSIYHSKEIMEMVKRCEEKYAQAKKLLEQAQKRYGKHANKTWRHVEFEVGQHVWLNIWDFKMHDGLTPCLIAKCVRSYETFHKIAPQHVHPKVAN